jgi:hypothetical protein
MIRIIVKHSRLVKRCNFFITPLTDHRNYMYIYINNNIILVISLNEFNQSNTIYAIYA